MAIFTPAHITKALHLMFSVTLAGLFVANYFYLAHSRRTQDQQLISYALRFNTLNDYLISLLLIGSVLTGSLMVNYARLSFDTRWIQAAYALIALTTLAWLGLLLIKRRYAKSEACSSGTKWLYHGLNVLLILFIAVIVHDAVMQTTYLWGTP